MLIFTRKDGESIMIDGGRIKITILGRTKKGYQTRVGIEAPKEVIIDREEIHNKRISDQWEKEKC